MAFGNSLPPVSAASTDLFSPTALSQQLQALTEEERRRREGDVRAQQRPGDVFQSSPAVRSLFSGIMAGGLFGG